MQIRVTGTQDECNATIDWLTATVDVLDVSGPYRNRGTSSLFRVYLTISTVDLMIGAHATTKGVNPDGHSR